VSDRPLILSDSWIANCTSGQLIRSVAFTFISDGSQYDFTWHKHVNIIFNGQLFQEMVPPTLINYLLILLHNYSWYAAMYIWVFYHFNNLDGWCEELIYSKSKFGFICTTLLELMYLLGKFWFHNSCKHIVHTVQLSC